MQKLRSERVLDALIHMQDMNPHTDSTSVLRSEIGQWEHALNCYTGDDPLDLWFKYICWLESNLATHQELEGKFRKSVEQCLAAYDKYDIYKQDLRLVKLYIKYIDFQPNPLNLYKILYQQGIGTKCAAFYIAWSHYYNSANHFKQAESIYNLGVQLKAEPLHELETAQKNFRFSVAQRMLYNDESSKKRTISSLEEQRQQITSLSPHQNQMHASKRLRTDSQGDQYNSTNTSAANSNGSVEHTLQNNQTQTQHQYVNSHHEYNNGYGSSSSTNNYSNSNVATNDAGFAICSSLSYVYDDSNGYASMEEPQQQQQQPQQPIKYTFENGFQMPPNFSNFARNSHEQWNVFLYLEEPYDPNRRCCYSKNLVYPGDDCEYSLEELKARKWKLKMYEKRQEEMRKEQERVKQEQERARQEQERIRLEQERIRQEAEARRLREEQERIRKEQEAQRIKMEQEKLQRQREEAERIRRQQEEEQRNRYNQTQMYQMQQQQQQHQHQIEQQQRWNYQQSSPANYPPNYHASYYHPSPQYSYSHDHQYQTHYSQTNIYHQHSPANYQNSPSYHQQSVIVNRTHYENPHYYMNYNTHSPVHPSQVPQPSPQQQQHYHHQQPPHSVMAHPQMQNRPVATPQQQLHAYNNGQQVHANQQPPQQFEEPDYQDVEYLIDHQAEIDPKMLQPMIEKKNNQEFVGEEEASDESYEEEVEEEEEEEEEEQIPTIVNSYMLDDLEEQIEASTISFSSNGKSRDKKLTIKFRKEKTTTTTTIINSESNSESSSSYAQPKVPLESTSTTSSTMSDKKKKKKKSKEIPTSYDGENTQFMPSGTNSCSSANNGENNHNLSFGKITFNGCVTPARKQGASKNSTPISTYKFLKNQSSFISNQNDDSICSFTGDQNSFFQAENDEEFKTRRMEKALATIEEHMNKRDIDPFSSELCRSLLVKLNFPNIENSTDYKVISTNLPKLIKNQTVPISSVHYQIEKEVGRGAYGAVYRGINLSDGSAVALKYQRPSNLATWELYICTEVKKRIKNVDILPGFMTISAAVIAPNASVLISEFSQYGSLLDINNRIRMATTKVMHESLVMHFSSQILNIIAHLHDIKIIHADIKPDNFLLMTLPSADTHIPSLRLIDFGCAIDMTFFKEGQEFRKIIETDGFTCVEMQEGRPWSYQTDLFCIAATIHVMLFGEYMQVNKKFGQWEIKQKFPRYLNKTLWTDVFSKLLNIKDIHNLPKLRNMKAQIDREINDNELVKNIRTVSNLIRKR